jgi:hypothetical protein
MKLVSLQEKIACIAGLTDDDLTPWEQGFVTTVNAKAKTAASTGQITSFSDKQVENIEKIYDKHFGIKR